MKFSILALSITLVFQVLSCKVPKRAEKKSQQTLSPNRTHSKDVKKIEITCPKDFILDKDKWTCSKAGEIKCPSGFSFDAETTSCLAMGDAYVICPKDFTYNQQTKKCLRLGAAMIECPEGFVYDAVSGKCTQSAEAVCPEGSELNASMGVCAPKCPPGQILNAQTVGCEIQSKQQGYEFTAILSPQSVADGLYQATKEMIQTDRYALISVVGNASSSADAAKVLFYHRNDAGNWALSQITEEAKSESFVQAENYEAELQTALIGESLALSGDWAFLSALQSWHEVNPPADNGSGLSSGEFKTAGAVLVYQTSDQGQTWERKQTLRFEEHNLLEAAFATNSKELDLQFGIKLSASHDRLMVHFDQAGQVDAGYALYELQTLSGGGQSWQLSHSTHNSIGAIKNLDHLQCPSYSQVKHSYYMLACRDHSKLAFAQLIDQSLIGLPNPQIDSTFTAASFDLTRFAVRAGGLQDSPLASQPPLLIYASKDSHMTWKIEATLNPLKDASGQDEQFAKPVLEGDYLYVVSKGYFESSIVSERGFTANPKLLVYRRSPGTENLWNHLHTYPLAADCAQESQILVAEGNVMLRCQTEVFANLPFLPPIQAAP